MAFGKRKLRTGETTDSEVNAGIVEEEKDERRKKMKLKKYHWKYL